MILFMIFGSALVLVSQLSGGWVPNQSCEISHFFSSFQINPLLNKVLRKDWVQVHIKKFWKIELSINVYNFAFSK